MLHNFVTMKTPFYLVYTRLPSGIVHILGKIAGVCMPENSFGFMYLIIRVVLLAINLRQPVAVFVVCMNFLILKVMYANV